MKRLFLAALCMALAITPIHLTSAEEAIETTKETASITDQAVALYDAEDYDNAVPLLQEAADQGDPVAQNKLGNCYIYGWGVEQDYEEGLKWYHLAADQGYPNTTLTNP